MSRDYILTQLDSSTFSTHTIMNVLIYSGSGTTTESVKHCLESLRLHLSPFYAVVTVNEATILNDPWMHKTSLLVIPGGADLPYCRILNGEGNRKITQYVRKGGKFLGICAGGYYGSARCEFEVGDPKMEVSGPRELGFFPGTNRGCAFKGFVYESHEGARAVSLDIDTKLLPGAPASTCSYYNGGGVFVDASSYKNVEVLARYSDKLDIQHTDKGDSESSTDRAAVVKCKVGQGEAILTGPHPEFTPSILKSLNEGPKFQNMLKTLVDSDHSRKLFLKSCLHKLGLKVNENVEMTVPRITPLYLSSHLDHSVVTSIAQEMKENLDFKGNVFEDLNDTFVIHDETENDSEYMIGERESEKDGDIPQTLETSPDNFYEEDPNAVPKHIKIFSQGNLPDSKLTPYFNMSIYFAHLQRYFKGKVGQFGFVLGYGEVVSSTSTLMDKNPNWLRHLPQGFTLTATTQVAGRGRGGNVWINPKGVMALSVLIKIPPSQNSTVSVVTLQYLCGLALIELILSYGSDDPGLGVGYDDLPVRLKWPNDIYILKSEFFNKLSDKDEIDSTMDGEDEKYAKVSGAMVNSQFLNGQFYIVWGGGVNVSNTAPTTSLNIVLARLNEIRAESGLPPLPPYQHEILLAKFMYTLDLFYNVFKHSGLTPFLPLYYKRWFHSNQRVRLLTGGISREVLVKGITPDYGLLIAEDVTNGDILELQPDGNSFDIFKGLVYKKR